MKRIKIKYVRNSNGYIVKPLERIAIGDWLDLHASENVTMKAGEFKLIPLGVAMELPKGYEAHIVPRSSTFKRWKVLQANGIGIIDHSFCSDEDVWMFPAYATEDTHINFNDRICQFRIVKNQPPVIFEIVEHLKNKVRGGFGSTGR